MNNQKITLDDRIFIAGANGMAGKAIKRNLVESGYKYLLTPSRNELDYSI